MGNPHRALQQMYMRDGIWRHLPSPVRQHVTTRSLTIGREGTSTRPYQVTKWIQVMAPF